jgi:adenylate kinase family enzyme
LDWPTKVLVNRWVERMRDDYDTLATYIKRDELYRKETLPLFPKPDFITSHEFEQETIDINSTIRK